MPQPIRLVFVLLLVSIAPLGAQSTLKLEPGDTVCLVGGAVGEAVDLEGTFEAQLHTRFPEHNIKVRSLCYPGDEVVRRARPAGFEEATPQLTREEASVVVGVFGFNESWAGPEGVEAFKAALEMWVDNTLAAKYRGEEGPTARVALATPAAVEPFPGGPDAKRLNGQIRLYADAVRGMAAKKQIPFADLFGATEKAFAAGAGMTSNGVTPTAAGAARIGLALDAGLFGRSSSRGTSETILEAVRKKSALFRDRYRPLNSDAVFGPRAGAGFEPDRGKTNGQVLGRELEILDALVAAADAEIWAAAAGGEKPATDNPPGAIKVETNFGSGRNRGKEGSTTYLKPSQAKGRFRVGAGYAIDLWASELDFPELANPTASCFDAAGRLWVTCAPGYPVRKPGAAAVGKVLVLDDFDHDGRADRCRVFADGLHVPTGLAVGDGGVYVAAAPDLLFLQDKDGDWKADERRALLTGFSTGNIHQSMGSLTWGPGGALYFGEGSPGVSAVETAWGTVRNTNAAVFRYHPVTRRLEIYAAYNFTNPHAIAFDEWGNAAIADSATGAIYHGGHLSGGVLPGDKHGPARPFAKSRSNPIAALSFVHGSHFPEDTQRDLLAGSCIGRLGALVFDTDHPDSAAPFVGSEVEPVFLTTDGNFRPIDLDFGPDGALYATDWHNALLGHHEHHLRDPTRDATHGRIWRIIAPERAPDPWPAIDSEDPRAVLPLLAHANPLVRRHALRELRQHPAGRILPAALKWGGALDRADPRYEQTLSEVLNLHAHFAKPNPTLLRAALRAESPDARAAATRLLADWRDAEPGALSMLRVLADDAHDRVKLEAIRACSFFDDERALEIVEAAAPAPEAMAEEAAPDTPPTPAPAMDTALKYVIDEALATLRKRFPPEMETTIP